MSSKLNIEDVFRSGVEDYTIKPSTKVWSGINKKLVGSRFEALYRNAFNGFKVSPSEQVWRRVAAVVWFNKFIHFTPFSFNVYYLAIITSAVIGTVVTVNNNPNLNFVHFNQESTKQGDVEKDTSSFEKMPFSEKFIGNYNELALTYNKQNVSTNPTLENVQTTNEDKDTNVLNPDLIATNNTATNPKNAVLPKNQNQNLVDNIVPNSIISDEQEPPPAVENVSDNNISNDNITIPTEPNSRNAESENKLTLKDYAPARLLRNLKYTLNYRPQWSEIADKAFVGLPQLDVISHDTIGYNYLGEPIIIEKSWLAIDAFFSPYVCQYNSALINDELQSNYNFYSENNKPGFSFSAGLGISYTYNRLRLETGISYHTFAETLSQNMYVKDTVTSYYFNYFDQERWDYDTTMILDLDEYLHGNIVYIPYVDSSSVIYIDSIQTARLDSVMVNKLFTADNSYRIIDFPLGVGYEFTYGKFSLCPKAGMIFGFATKRSGTAFNITDGNILEASNLLANRILFDYYGAVNIQYSISKHLSVFIEPHVRGDLNSLYQQSYAISEKSRKYGIKTGISYKF